MNITELYQAWFLAATYELFSALMITAHLLLFPHNRHAEHQRAERMMRIHTCVEWLIVGFLVWSVPILWNTLFNG